eukprot:TRINITY_DN708_c0_g1_i8.p1 TRINITY_DN708_c0_g1~~TRINITY_DN708_c0_g1_i8.p1  ORF type:complete len:133 (+),score=40.19 TRINITY_DN708_c0_g1_i8:188-586(+)
MQDPEEFALSIGRQCVQAPTLDRMNLLFVQLDRDGNRVINVNDFYDQLNSPDPAAQLKVKALLDELGRNFDMNGDRSVTEAEFLEGFVRMALARPGPCSQGGTNAAALLQCQVAIDVEVNQLLSQLEAFIQR